jgi:hypothetical protein
MNTQNNLGVWVSTPQDLTKIPDVISHIPDLKDIFIISEGNIFTTNYAVISPFYISFATNPIAFLSVKDYLANKDSIRSQNIFLFCKVSEILDNGIDKKSLINVKVIEL